ncbi:GntR family transcriptional regulator [Rhodococcus sp. T2V]|uniref:GntR family transcriptional regulator n=1 Tax=Rhodococcus sp. T2V TaxID=3034164 RepID=UPI0023E281AE|nr:GntR family transcriptional regulator [Rhodococcus sp. T2V]MDF3305838.1 GntR family transcriptional regulator [Rhodococcus sp. T2V]
MTLSTEKATLAETVHDKLRDELLRGELPPGSKVHISETAARHGVSPSVLREALTRLAERGLVVAMPQRGFTVAALSVGDLTDLTRARTLIEAMALRESIADGDLSWESSVLAAHHRLQRTAMIDDDGDVRPDWSEAHRQFHHVLLSGGTSRRLTSIADGLRDCSDLYIHWSRVLAHDDHRDAAAEHQQIADLTLARDADGAAAALVAHIERTTEVLIGYANAVASTADGSATA